MACLKNYTCTSLIRERERERESLTFFDHQNFRSESIVCNMYSSMERLMM